MTNPLVLSFDTSAAHVAAALLCGDEIIARKVEEMKRGQAERLVPLLEGYRTTELGVYAIYTSRRQLPLKLRFLIAFLVDAFQNPAWRSEE